MPDVYALAALVYLAAMIATGAGRLVLACLQRRRKPSRMEALLLALLPPVVLSMALLGSRVPLNDALHERLHRWAPIVPASEGAHALLHSANGLLLLLLASRALITFHWWASVQIDTRALQRLSSPETSLDGVAVRVLPTEKPHCFTVGVLRPSVYVSKGMLALLAGQERAAMLAHEEAHRSRRDGFWTLALRSFYSLLLLPGSGALIRAWEAAAERECDLVAARQVGSACTVAAALVRVGSLSQGRILAGSLAFGAKAGHLEERVHALLTYDPTQTLPTARPLGVVVGLVALSLLVVTPVLTHLAEIFAYH